MTVAKREPISRLVKYYGNVEIVYQHLKRNYPPRFEVIKKGVYYSK